MTKTPSASPRSARMGFSDLAGRSDHAGVAPVRAHLRDRRGYSRAGRGRNTLHRSAMRAELWPIADRPRASDGTHDSATSAASTPSSATVRTSALTVRPDTETAHAPIILDIDIGGNPDALIALRCAALRPELVLVITADEIDGERARLARYALDMMGRTDVRVVSGADLGHTRYWVMDGVVPVGLPRQSKGVLRAVEAVFAMAQGNVRWVGGGPLTTLAQILRAAPEVNKRLLITQAGGTLHHGDSVRPEHNFRLDPASARFVIDTAEHVTLVVSNVTYDAIALHPGHPIHRALSAPDTPGWARLITLHLNRWADAFDGRASKQRDPLALWVALGDSAVELDRIELAVGFGGQIIHHSTGRLTTVTRSADYRTFHRWIWSQLTHDAA